MQPFRLYAATGDAVAQLDSRNGETVVASLNLEGRGVMCIAVGVREPKGLENVIRSRSVVVGYTVCLYVG